MICVAHVVAPLPHKVGEQICARLRMNSKKNPQPRRENRVRSAACSISTQREHRFAPKAVVLRGAA